VSEATNTDFDAALRGNRGLDLTSVERTSADEQRSFQDYYRKVFGRSHRGLDFWLDKRPDILKRYRLFAELQSRPGGLQTDWRFHAFSFYTQYAMTGYAIGIRDLTFMNQVQGLTREQILEGLGIVFLHGGPRGMETIAEALADFHWIAPGKPAEFPDGWDVDPDAFKSGLDFSTWTMSGDEVRNLEGWYERWLGEVPRYVRFLVKNRPEMLKTHRYRYENLIRVLPKQVMPMTLLSYNVMRGFEPGIRENVLLARGFGVAREDVIGEINQTLINAGMEGLDTADRAVGDILERWPE
jgi:hypothetical protein